MGEMTKREKAKENPCWGDFYTCFLKKKLLKYLRCIVLTIPKLCHPEE